jgi:hypothetical protein
MSVISTRDLKNVVDVKICNILLIIIKKPINKLLHFSFL